jgi:hypothetical protein
VIFVTLLMLQNIANVDNVTTLNTAMILVSLTGCMSYLRFVIGKSIAVQVASLYNNNWSANK